MNIIKRDLLLLLRDKSSLFFIVLFPSLMVVLLGNLLQQLDNSDAVIAPFEIQISIVAQDPIITTVTEEWILALNENPSVTVTEHPDISIAKKSVEEGTIAAAVLVSDEKGVEIYEGFDRYQNRAVQSMFRGLVRQVAGIRAILSNGPAPNPDAAQTARIPGSDQETVDLHAPYPNESAQSDSATELWGDRSLISQESPGYSRSMLDYYAVTMIVMILFMGGAMGGMSAFYDTRRDGTLRRVLASGQSRSGLFLQSVLSAVPQNLLQVGCVMVSSVLLFGARYAETVGDNLLLFSMLLCTGMAVSALCIMLGMFIRFNPTFLALPLTWVLMFLSGTFSKEVFIEGVTNRSPVWIVQKAAFDLTVFGNAEPSLRIIGVSMVVLAVCTAIGAVLFRRKELAL